ncbi:MAG: glycosyltransferase [Nannocystis sp.]|nr:glycosyltransferase family 2 protein [Nannocystis sp.]MBA3544861.1 glycosyltransferase [Nannocystis sp.]
MPRVSVVIRSYNRHRALCQLLHSVLLQRFQDFEVVVVEQSTRPDPEAAAELAALQRDPRIRVLRFPPLGGPRARNEGARASRGELLLLMDDDDLPLDDGWIDAHLRNFEDPNCVAVTGRWIHERATGRPPYRNMDKARRRVLSYVPVLMYQRVYAGADRRRVVASIYGGNVSIRRDALARYGLWDECTTVEDELSLCYRFLRHRRAGEYAVFDPEAVMVRRLDIPGGMDKRYQGLLRFGWRHFEFLHNIIGHYFPVRFVLLYPIYAVLLWIVILESLWGNTSLQDYATTPRRLLATVALTLGFPLLWVGWLVRLLWKRGVAGAPQHAPQL